MQVGNIIDYVNEFRTISLKEKPFDEVDSLVLSQVSYYNFSCGEFTGNSFKRTLAELLEKDSKPLLESTTIVREDDVNFIEALAEAGRHGSLRVSHYVEIMDVEVEKQFAAMTFEVAEGEYAIVFRGTDISVTGWKEDLAMCYEEFIPAQKEALEYTKKVMDDVEGNFYLCGHSKGGNLSVYTAIHLPLKYRKRLLAVYDHDGPGFVDSVYVGEDYWKIRSLIKKTVPKSSVIGLMWQADDNYKVVLSDEKLLAQHDPFTWIVEGGRFKETETVDTFSKYTKTSLESWVDTLSRAERKQLVNTVFDVIYGAGIDSFDDLVEDTLPNVLRLIAEVAEMDKNERENVLNAVKQLLLVYQKEIPLTVKAERDAKLEEQVHKLKLKIQKLKKDAKKNLEIIIKK